MTGIDILAGFCILAAVLLWFAFAWLDRQEQQDYADLQRDATSYVERQAAAMEQQRIRLKRMRRPYDWSEGDDL